MSYNTNYSLTMEPYNKEIHEHLLKTINDGYDPFEEDCKWYEWEKEMREFSLLYPDTLFHISGIGDGVCDMWEATFKNGKAHIRPVVPTIDPFDPMLLK